MISESFLPIEIPSGLENLKLDLIEGVSDDALNNALKTGVKQLTLIRSNLAGVNPETEFNLENLREIELTRSTNIPKAFVEKILESNLDSVNLSGISLKGINPKHVSVKKRLDLSRARNISPELFQKIMASQVETLNMSVPL